MSSSDLWAEYMEDEDLYFERRVLPIIELIDVPTPEPVMRQVLEDIKSQLTVYFGFNTRRLL